MFLFYNAIKINLKCSMHWPRQGNEEPLLALCGWKSYNYKRTIE